MDSVKSDVPRESVHKLRRLHSSQLYSSVKPTPDASGDQVWCTPLPAWVSNAFDRVPAARLWDDQQDNRLPEYLTQDYFPADDGSFCPTESERFLPLESHVTVDRVSLERMQAEPMVGATRRPSLPIPRVCSVQEMREMGHLGCRWDELGYVCAQCSEQPQHRNHGGHTDRQGPDAALGTGVVLRERHEGDNSRLVAAELCGRANE